MVVKHISLINFLFSNTVADEMWVCVKWKHLNQLTSDVSGGIKKLEPSSHQHNLTQICFPRLPSFDRSSFTSSSSAPTGLVCFITDLLLIMNPIDLWNQSAYGAQSQNPQFFWIELNWNELNLSHVLNPSSYYTYLCNCILHCTVFFIFCLIWLFVRFKSIPVFYVLLQYFVLPCCYCINKLVFYCLWKTV